jgi:hypothetical protein
VDVRLAGAVQYLKSLIAKTVPSVGDSGLFLEKLPAMETYLVVIVVFVVFAALIPL